MKNSTQEEVAVKTSQPVGHQIQDEKVAAKVNTQKQSNESVNTKEWSKDDDNDPLYQKLVFAAQERQLIIMDKILLTAFMMGLLAAAASWYLAAPIYLIVIVGTLAFSLANHIGQALCDRMADVVNKRGKDVTNWEQQNGDAYKLGCKSAKAWLPYLKSYVYPKGYTSAYHLGLNETCIKKRGLELALAEHQAQMKAKKS